MDINQIIQELKQKENTYQQQRGRLDQLLRQLNDVGFDLIEDAEKWLEDNNKKINDKKRLREDNFTTFTKKYGNLL